MNGNTIDAIARLTGAMNRRGSLRLLGGAALVSTLVSPPGTVVGRASNHKNKNKNKNKRAKQPCKNQEQPGKNQQPQCVTAATTYCTTWIDRTECEGLLLPCCAQFADGNVEPGLACLFAAISTG